MFLGVLTYILIWIILRNFSGINVILSSLKNLTTTVLKYVNLRCTKNLPEDNNKFDENYIALMVDIRLQI